ncbi:MAG TPA: alpha-glucuronidase family glycosyl hydrolase [Planctomycetota bacterium]|nr:alpha-glucuronidase family glycosyl hydrolase [Planctomycetota bacterium]
MKPANPLRLWSLLLLGAAVFPVCLAPAGEPPAGQAATAPRFVIVLGEKSSDPEKFAAEFLAERLRRSLGAEAAVGASAPAAGDATAIILGTPESNPALAKFRADLPKDAPEGFLITTDGGATVLVGASPRAVVYASARLLSERGWRFRALHDLGEVAIDPKTAMPAGPIQDAPVVAIRATVTDSLGDVMPRYLDWMVFNGLNRLVVRVDLVGVGSVAATSRELARRGLTLELCAPESWWRIQAGLKGDEKPEDVAARLGEAQRKAVEKAPGAVASTLEAVVAARGYADPLGAPFAGPRAPLGDIRALVGREPRRDAVLIPCPPRRLLFDESSVAAGFFAASAWKGPQPAEEFVRDHCRRYYGGGEAGEDIAAYFLGLEAMGAELAAPEALLNDATYGRWKTLVDRFRGAREKTRADTPPRKRIALHLRAVLDHQQSCADAARLIRSAEGAADPVEKRRLLLEAVKTAWDYNRRKEPRLFDMNPGDAYGLRAPSGRSPELEGEMVQLEKARTLLLAGDDGKVVPGLVAAALAEGGGGKVAVSALAAEVGGNKAENFADGKPGTGTILRPGPGGRFGVDLGKEVTVSRIRFLGSSERPITQYRIVAVDASGAAITLAKGMAEAPGMFVAQELSWPAAKVRTLLLEVERYESARADGLGPALAEFEAYEK